MRRVTVFIGIERDAAGAQLNPEVRANALRAIRTDAAQYFGGYTLSNAEGGWVDPDGKLVEEGAIRLDVYTDHGAVQVERWARDAGKLFKQHSVMLDDNGVAQFVTVQ